MKVDLLLTRAGHVATLRGPRGPKRGRGLRGPGLVAGGAVAVRDGRVVDVGPTPRLRARYQAATVLDAEGGLVTPGFVDPHNHLPFAGNRAFELRLKLAGKSYESILKAGGGILRTIRDTQGATLSELTRLVRERARTMLAWGTTTSEAKSGYGRDWPHERKQLEAVRRASDPHGVELVPTFLGAHAVPPRPPGGRAAWVRRIAHDMVPAVAKARLADFVDVFLDRAAYTREEARIVLDQARRHGLRTKLHADEFTNQRAAELGAETGATSCDHLLRVSKRGIARLAASSSVAVLLPGVAALGFLDSQAPARALVEAGAAVALGTDFNPNCPVLTMPTVLQWGVYELRLTPEEALAACTTNAAHALGRGNEVGRIEKGYQADLLVHDVASVEELAYWVGQNPVRAVVKRGKVRVGRG
ncbi:MAG: imidazolonepropionase [Euryarchaeota archaeon]|nr:imidazolonepropionase [Euryarchaeota archaeon]